MHRIGGVLLGTILLTVGCTAGQGTEDVRPAPVPTSVEVTQTSLPPRQAYLQGLRQSEVLATTTAASASDGELLQLGAEFCRQLRIFAPVYEGSDPGNGSPTPFGRSVQVIAEERLAPGTTVGTTVEFGSPAAAATAIGAQAVVWLCPEYRDLAPG